MSTIFEPPEWRRYGGGRVHQFYATDQDLQELLKTSLPAKFAPYTLISDFLVEGPPDRYTSSHEEVGIDDFLSQRNAKEKRQDFFIRSHRISPNLDLSEVAKLDLFLYVNGLDGLHHGFVHGATGWSESRLVLMQKIYNDETDELYIHSDYNRIYNALRRGLKKILRYRSKWTNIDGEVVELPHVHMTEAFVDKIRTGEIRTIAVPGDPL